MERARGGRPPAPHSGRRPPHRGPALRPYLHLICASRQWLAPGQGSAPLGQTGRRGPVPSAAPFAARATSVRPPGAVFLSSASAADPERGPPRASHRKRGLPGPRLAKATHYSDSVSSLPFILVVNVFLVGVGRACVRLRLPKGHFSFCLHRAGAYLLPHADPTWPDGCSTSR